MRPSPSSGAIDISTSQGNCLSQTSSLACLATADLKAHFHDGAAKPGAMCGLSKHSSHLQIFAVAVANIEARFPHQ